MSGRLLATLLASGAVLGAQQTLVEGKPDSPVRIVIYEDLQCPDCAAFREMMDQKLLPRYGEKVAFVHRDFPLVKHAWARRAALAARYFADKQPALDLAWRRYILGSIRETTADNFNEKLAAFARRHGANPAEAVAGLDNPRYAELVEKDFQDGVARGVSHTPTVLVNGQPFVETFTFEEISKAIDQALKSN